MVRVRAHAKINLLLRVLGSRGDGYHELRTILQAVDLHDTLVFASRPGPLQVRCGAAGVPLDGTNLVARAAGALWTALGRPGEPADLQVVIDKRIPVAAGLGGGSSNAAAALRGLLRLWRARLPEPELAAVAAGLGADVPFFLCGGAALGLGRGDEIFALADLPVRWVVVLVPPFGVTTAEAYRWYDADRDAGRLPEAPRGVTVPGRLAGMVLRVANDLEAAVAARHADVDRMKARLVRHGASVAAMSGSGSAVFGLFATRDQAMGAARALARGPWRAIVARALGRRDDLARSAPVWLGRLPRSVRLS